MKMLKLVIFIFGMVFANYYTSCNKIFGGRYEKINDRK